MVLWRPTRPFRSNTPKKCPFHYRGLECKSRKSRDTWSNRQIWHGITEWSRAKANRVLPREDTSHSKHSLPTTQEKTLHVTSPDCQYRNQIDYIICSQRWRQSILSAKIRPGGNFGSDHELLIAKFRNKLKKVGKTRPFVYDLNKSPTIIQWKWQIDSRDEIWQIECLKNHWREFITLYRRWRFQRLQKGTKFCYAYVLKGQQSLPQGCTILCCPFLTWLCILSFP